MTSGNQGVCMRENVSVQAHPGATGESHDLVQSSECVSRGPNLSGLVHVCAGEVVLFFARWCVSSRLLACEGRPRVCYEEVLIY